MECPRTAGQQNKNEQFQCEKTRDKVPTHIVIHVTGTKDFSSVRRTFTAPKSVSSHYLVHSDGGLFQFVPDAGRAYHSGIDKSTASLYKKGGKEWQKYLKYFSWYRITRRVHLSGWRPESRLGQDRGGFRCAAGRRRLGQFPVLQRALGDRQAGQFRERSGPEQLLHRHRNPGRRLGERGPFRLSRCHVRIVAQAGRPALRQVRNPQQKGLRRRP